MEKGSYLCNEDAKEVWHLFHNCQYSPPILGFMNLQFLGVGSIQDWNEWLEFLTSVFSSLETRESELLVEGIWMQWNLA